MPSGMPCLGADSVVGGSAVWDSALYPGNPGARTKSRVIAQLAHYNLIIAVDHSIFGVPIEDLNGSVF